MSALSEYSIGFDSPWFLLLLLVVPALWVFSYRGLSGLGTSRRIVALVLRTLVYAILVMAIAGFQMKRASDRLTVIYVIDMSLSIPKDQRDAMRQYVNQVVARYRAEHPRDRVGAVVFGRDAAMEIPPFDEDMRIPQTIETHFDPEYTNLEGALKLAEASFPEDAAKRIVILSDGNQNLGDALRQARGMAEKGISIDVVPIRYPLGGDVLVEKVALPADIRKGQPVDLRVVLNNTNQTDVTGLLRIERQTDGPPVLLNPDRATQLVTLRPDKSVFSFRLTLDEPQFYKYQANFLAFRKIVLKSGDVLQGSIESQNDREVLLTPAEGGERVTLSRDDIRQIEAYDNINENNRASSFTYVRGKGRVLFIEDRNHRGEFEHLIVRLRQRNIEVDVRPSDSAFSSLAELQQYDSVILGNLPRFDLNDERSEADKIEQLTSSQVDMLISNTQHTGAGLVMLGGDRSFGNGHWQDTELEKAMPVDFTIKNAKVVPKGAVALIMHASETANGNYWMKLTAKAAIEALGAQDYCGLLTWNGVEQWLWRLDGRGMVAVGENRGLMLRRLNAMQPGDMPDFAPTMRMALQEFARIKDASNKLLIIISDGDPAAPPPGLIQQFVKAGIVISTVEITSHGNTGTPIMRQLATATGGKFYFVRNNKALPKIYQREVRRVAMPLVHNGDTVPQIVRAEHEIVSGVPSMPVIHGYVRTTPKEHPLVELIAQAPDPTGSTNPILAAWTYGLGRTVCFTTDTGQGKGWADRWLAWENYDRLFEQIVRWSMRPGGDEQNYSMVTKMVEDKVGVIVTALDKENNPENRLNISGLAVDPESKAKQFALKQVAPGRYVGEFDAKDVGSYMVVLSPGAGKGTLRAGVNVPYSAEFRSRETNVPLLAQLASLTPKDGKPGELIDEQTFDAADEREAMEEMLKINSFRHDLPRARSSQDAWYYLVVLAAILFFCDVFVRRVQIGFEWVAPLARRIMGRQEQAAPSEYLARLRSRKEEVTGEIEARRAAARFEPQPDVPVTDDDIVEAMAGPATGGAPPPKPAAKSLAPQEEEESYTDRLLKAKKKALEEERKKKESG